MSDSYRPNGPIASPFPEIPSGIAIAHYFLEECRGKSQGCDGFPLWRDGSDYCYLWVLATVDLDLEEFYLLDIRTNRDHHETRDHLFVATGIGGKLEVEWRNAAINFSDDAIDRLYEGLKWFYNDVVGFTERQGHWSS